jgi:hypothetical protein
MPMTMAEFKELYGVDSDTHLKKHFSKAGFDTFKKIRAIDDAEYKKEIGEAAFAKFKEGLDRRPYLARIPKSEDVPGGIAIVHNRVVPAKSIGARGFRIWAQALDDSDYPIEVCSCTWAPELGRHYRVKERSPSWPQRSHA